MVADGRRSSQNNDTPTPTLSLVAAISMADIHSQLLVQTFLSYRRLQTLQMLTNNHTPNPHCRRLLQFQGAHPAASFLFRPPLSGASIPRPLCAPMKSEPGPPMTLGNAAKAELRLSVW